MGEKQETNVIQIKELLDKVRAMKDAGYRLVQVGATRLPEGFEINYTFDKGYQFANYRIILPSQDTAIPSISGIYWGGFLYENEIHDLFGIKIDGIAVDYQGKFYRTAVKAPFGEKK